MTPQFNLADEAWIPVIYSDGTSSTVGWRDLIAESERIVDIQTDPAHLYAPILRLATAIFLRTQGAPFGDPAPVVWQAWGVDRLESGVDVSALDNYLAEWRDRFWLVHDVHPFLQDPMISDECSDRASTNKLFFDVASGNNHIWWTKTLDSDAPVVPFPAAALALVGQWAYAAGGRCTTRDGVANSKQAPLRQFTQFMPRGATLFETLLMASTPAALDYEFATRDVPAWEVDTLKGAVPGQLGRLTISTRGILLFPEGGGISAVVNTWGKDAPSDTFWEADVFMAKRIVKEEIIPKRLSPASTTWREVEAILAHREESDARLAPTALDAARNPLGSTEAFFDASISVVTHFADKSKDLGWSRSEVLEVLAVFGGDNPAAAYAVTQFCEVAGELVYQVSILIAQSAKDGPKRPVITDGTLFALDLWHEAESLFYEVLRGSPWEEAVRRLSARCVERYDEATVCTTTPVHIAEVVKYRRFLLARMRRISHQYGLETEDTEVQS